MRHLAALLTVAGCLGVGVLLGLVAAANRGRPGLYQAFAGGLLGLVAGLAISFPGWRVWTRIFGPPDDQGDKG